MRIRGRAAWVVATLAAWAWTAALPAAPAALIEVDAAEILQIVRELEAPAVLVNVWATWCTPCREEFPDLIRLRRDYAARGLRLVLVSADFAEDTDDALEFLAAHGVDFPSYLKVGDDMEFIDALDRRWSGALPATFIYDQKGKLRHFWQGKASYEKLERTVLEVLASSRAMEVSE